MKAIVISQFEMKTRIATNYLKYPQ